MVYFSPRMDHVHLIGLNTLSKQTGGGYLPCAPAEWSLFYIQQGTATVSISAQSVHVHKGDFLLLPPLSCHEIEINGDSFVTLILFSGISAPHPEFFCHLTAEDTATAQPILSLLVDRNNLTYRAQDHILEALLIQLFSLSAFLWNEPPMSSLPIDILKYLNTHYQEDLVLNDLAETFNISVSHVIHVFNPLVGLSPIQYLIHRRIGSAQYMLRRTSQRADEIAAQIGIPNRNYFYRTFKRLTGLSPSQYRTIICDGTHHT